MYAVCPKCQNSQAINAQQLKKKRGKATCSQCKHPFNPRTSLSDRPLKVVNENEIQPYAWQKPVNSHSKLWLICSLLATLLLIYQVYYFKGYSLAQSTQIRPWLQSISTAINYPLPRYRNSSEFTIIGSSFSPLKNNNYRLQVSFINHANFSQALPNLNLTLQNLHGGIIAQRLFTPKEYLKKSINPPLIASNKDFDIDLLIAVPNKNIGGYQIALQ